MEPGLNIFFINILNGTTGTSRENLKESQFEVIIQRKVVPSGSKVFCTINEKILILTKLFQWMPS